MRNKIEKYNELNRIVIMLYIAILLVLVVDVHDFSLPLSFFPTGIPLSLLILSLFDAFASFIRYFPFSLSAGNHESCFLANQSPDVVFSFNRRLFERVFLEKGRVGVSRAIPLFAQ